MSRAYLSFSDFEKELGLELSRHSPREKITQFGRLFLAPGPERCVWSQLELGPLTKIDFKSISDAAQQLKTQGKNWLSYSCQLHRRTSLIQEKLSSPRPLDLRYPVQNTKTQDFGFFTLLSENQLLFSSRVLNPSSARPFRFKNEDAINPPSRAYLKLWEAFSFHVKAPRPGERVIDMGSCPGGWTWVLQNLGCQVTSVDKAPLDGRLLSSRLVQPLKRDAFELRPDELGDLDWFFSDIICDPADLYDLVIRWITKRPDLKFLCTIKYRGQPDFETTEKFAQINNSKVVHLFHNKNEATWIKT
jgi:23S rRNA (cytidine2498-2'-O)-methyltransferase